MDVQTCYRHDDRRAGVRCQRCERPICSSCMNEAAVGFHCPECVRRSGQRVHTRQTLLAADPGWVTKVLIALNLVVYVASTVGAGGDLADPAGRFVFDWGLIGLGLGPGGFVGVAEGEWWRLVTGGFLHGGLLHIAFNMYALWMLGRQAEGGIGRTSFATVYVTSLLAGSLGVLLLDPTALTVGASGAVFGLFGYAFVNQRARGINPFQTGIGGIIVVNLLLTFGISGISIGGHIGGLVGGALASLLHDIARQRLRLPTWMGPVLVLGLGAACLAASFAVAGSLTVADLR